MVIADPWLSETLNKPAYKLALTGTDFSESAQRELKKFSEHATANTFAYCKIPVSSVRAAHDLESAGFRLVDTGVLFEKAIEKKSRDTAGLTLQFAKPGDEGDVVRLAGQAFEFSRFHQDPRIEKESANRIKAKWVENFFAGKRGEWLVVARHGDRIAGFLLLLKEKEGVLTIDLIGVGRDSRKRGVASSMIAFAEAHCPDVTRIRVGTQIANTASINLYEKLGFRLSESQYVFHYHS